MPDDEKRAREMLASEGSYCGWQKNIRTLPLEKLPPADRWAILAIMKVLALRNGVNTNVAS